MHLKISYAHKFLYKIIILIRIWIHAWLWHSGDPILEHLYTSPHISYFFISDIMINVGVSNFWSASQLNCHRMMSWVHVAGGEVFVSYLRDEDTSTMPPFQWIMCSVHFAILLKGRYHNNDMLIPSSTLRAFFRVNGFTRDWHHEVKDW